MNSCNNTRWLKTIDTSLNNIETDIDLLAKTKVMFNARLTDGTNQYLDRLDYSGGSAIDFYWQNDKGTPAYITKYQFVYQENSSPTHDQLYHSTAWTSKIGAMNSGETDYEAPFVTVDDNKFYVNSKSSGGVKQNWFGDSCFCFEVDFDEAPIEIGISRKFGHYIQADLTTTSYDSDPVGMIQGFYLA